MRRKRRKSLLASQSLRLPVRLLRQHGGHDDPAAVPAELRARPRRPRRKGHRVLVGGGVQRLVLRRRAGVADLGLSRRPLRPQADADPRLPRHDDRRLGDGHGAERLRVGGAAGARRLPRRLHLGLGDPGGEPDAQEPFGLGARQTVDRLAFGNADRAAARRRRAGADRPARDLLGGRRVDLRRLPVDDLRHPRGPHPAPAARERPAAAAQRAWCRTGGRSG